MEATIIGESLKRLLEIGTVNQRRTLKDAMCKSLQEAYENTVWAVYEPDIDIPGAGKSPSQKGREDPRRPGDEIEEQYDQIKIVTRARMSERKLKLLNEALRWGCKWAQEELVRIGGKLPIYR